MLMTVMIVIKMFVMNNDCDFCLYNEIEIVGEYHFTLVCKCYSNLRACFLKTLEMYCSINNP